MVISEFGPAFEKRFRKIKDNSLKDRLKKHIAKIIDAPEIGKPMMYNRKGTRELYVPPFRISYIYSKEDDRIILLDFYHKDDQ
ncbi:MAG: type II toxin-antitoxin system RelE/ParE family toxin [Candidatus Woesearchaeota archaeon]|nr:type II toxin-antitoxin system RelE/ParE family toxin [Candidatus Woesearchaeota archaeon]